MIERPIMFSGPMVQALREARKTQTRRTRGLDKINAKPDAWELLYSGGIDNAWWTFARRDNPDVVEKIHCPYGVAGDRLWTRETWSAPVKWNGVPPRDIPSWAGCWWKADDNRPLSAADLQWRPSIHMPRWASRDTLKVVSTRPERLHAITKDDALAEGIQVLPLQSADDPSAWYQSAPGIHQSRTAAGSYAQLWDEINGKRLPWSNSPWVWRVEFSRR